MQIYVLPSLLAADFGHLEDGARLAETAGGDLLHLDIMDGHFVPNLSMGPAVVAMARRCVSMPLSVHLMLSRPDLYLDAFTEAGANTIQIHVEAECDVSDALEQIAAHGLRRGLVLNPATPADALTPYLDQVDEILCMTVNPGYGGQSFMQDVLPKIKTLRTTLEARGYHSVDIMVDGGIAADTTAECAAAGANAFVAGSSLYGAPDMRAAIDALRKAASAAFNL